MAFLSRKLNEEIVIDRTVRVRLPRAGRGRFRLAAAARRRNGCPESRVDTGGLPERRKQEASMP